MSEVVNPEPKQRCFPPEYPTTLVERVAYVFRLDPEFQPEADEYWKKTYMISKTRTRGMDLEDYMLLPDMERVIRVNFKPDVDEAKSFSVEIQDILEQTNDEGDVFRTKIVTHTWEVQPGDGRYAKPLSSKRQESDVARGGVELRPAGMQATSVTSYLGMATDTNEGVVRMIEKLRFMWDTPFDWSTVQ